MKEETDRGSLVRYGWITDRNGLVVQTGCNRKDVGWRGVVRKMFRAGGTRSTKPKYLRARESSGSTATARGEEREAREGLRGWKTTRRPSAGGSTQAQLIVPEIDERRERHAGARANETRRRLSTREELVSWAGEGSGSGRNSTSGHREAAVVARIDARAAKMQTSEGWPNPRAARSLDITPRSCKK